MDLTAAQQRVVDHETGRLRVRGAAGTGKTVSLVARYVHLSRAVDASRLLVLCPNRAAAIRFRDAVLPELGGGFDALPITTIHGLAHDLVTRGSGPLRLLVGAEQRAVVRELLDAEGADAWPVLHPLLRRNAFIDETAEAVLAHQAALVDDAHLQDDDRWRELTAFTTRYLDVLDSRGCVDASGLLVRALAAAATNRFDHVLVDDHEPGAPVAMELLERVALRARSICLTDSVGSEPADVELAGSFRHLERPPELVRCGHPAVEAEAIAGELQRAHHDGVAWSQMVVLVRRPADRTAGVARALARHGIPVASSPGLAADEPVVRAVIDMLRWINGDDAALERLLVSPLAGLDATQVRDLRRRARHDETGGLSGQPELAALVALRDDLAARAAHDDPADLAHEIWRRALSHLVDNNGAGRPGDDRALDALVAFLDGLQRHTERNPGDRLPQYLALLEGPALEPDSWRISPSADGDMVTISSITAAAGREWDTVVIAGCVEGELPAGPGRIPFFDPERLLGENVRSLAERRRAAIADERRRFAEIACTRSTRQLVGTAAPEPGVLLSRFVESWPARPPELPLGPGPALVERAPTAGVPLYGDGRLRLSASRLDTYDDCPLRYAYEYVLHVRRDAGVQAGLGSLFHAVLAEFLDPARTDPRTHEALIGLAAERWTDEIARYRPQAEEARRDYFDMLERWWEVEGRHIEHGQGPDVLTVERRFTIEVGPHTINGAIDRVDRADDGSGIRIVDYKTGRREPSSDDMADNLQLAVYHLAASRDGELMALGPATQLRLLFPRTMNAYDQEILPDHADSTEARILATGERILAEDFEPSVHANCRYCSFQRLCPIQVEGREVGVR
jgi:superfamily I DNA/RNA helicase/RecB family exonuclease